MLFNTERRAALLLRNLPRDIRDGFKAYCAKRGQNMKDALLDYMKECIISDQFKPSKKKRKKNGNP